MDNLRILVICPQPLWPMNTGARLRNFHLANALGNTCKVSILQIANSGESTTPETPSSFQEVLSATRGKSYTPLKLVRGMTGPMPVTVLNYTSEEVASVLSKLLASAQFDAVQLESIHLFRYLDTIQQSRQPPAVVLDWHNIESELMLRYAESTSNLAKKLIAARTARLLEKLETKALHSFTAHLVVSEREKQKLVLRGSNAPIHVIPNGVDTNAFTSAPLPSPTPPSRQILLFVGSMDYHANSDAVIWFCREIWPLLAHEFPSLDFKIVGRKPPASVQALASSRIFVTGTVDDVRPFYREAFAVLIPLRVGGGTRLKILEAMAAGVPVISTRLGAEGIAIHDRCEILLADTSIEMASAIRSLLSQPALAGQLRDAARKLVTQHYDWAVLGEKLYNIYRSQRN